MAKELTPVHISTSGVFSLQWEGTFWVVEVVEMAVGQFHTLLWSIVDGDDMECEDSFDGTLGECVQKFREWTQAKSEERCVGPLAKAALCSHCGATCPNSWSDPRGYVVVGERVYCSEACEKVAK